MRTVAPFPSWISSPDMSETLIVLRANLASFHNG